MELTQIGKIYLWSMYKGWQLFDRNNERALSVRNINIGENVMIGDGAYIYSRVAIGDNSRIGNNTIIYLGTVIGSNVSIGDRSIINDFVKISNSVIIPSEANIEAGKVIRISFVGGSRHPLYYYDTDIVHIGCMKETVNWWFKNIRSVLILIGYSEAEIKEYYDYIVTIKNNLLT